MWLRYWVRGLIAVAVGLVVFVAFALSPALWDTALIASWDAGVATWLVLTFVEIGRADAKCTWEQSQALEPGSLYMLAVVIIASVVGLLGAIALSARTAGRGQAAQSLHFGAAVIAVIQAWLFVHVEFGLYYARLYYDETGPEIHEPPEDARAFGEFRKGLEFPEGELVDYWAFMYYAFTIAMCYQTSDVTVTSPLMRKLTLGHSILSFAFVLILLSFTVNAIGTIL